jgi:YHS domain-containing protein
MKTLTFLALAIATSLSPLAPAAFADKAPIYTGLFSKQALEGYDAVSYFQPGGPVKGDKAFTTTHKGVEWRFASAANLSAFTADPAKYEPQFGGYCAWAVSQGYTAKGDPKYWAVVGGKLYLNYDAKVQKAWETDRTGFISKGNANWPTVLTK